MMMRSSRTEPPDLQACVIKSTDDIIGQQFYLCKAKLFKFNVYKLQKKILFQFEILNFLTNIKF
jgi:hypothetical protein